MRLQGLGLWEPVVLTSGRAQSLSSSEESVSLTAPHSQPRSQPRASAPAQRTSRTDVPSQEAF